MAVVCYLQYIIIKYFHLGTHIDHFSFLVLLTGILRNHLTPYMPSQPFQSVELALLQVSLNTCSEFLVWQHLCFKTLPIDIWH